MDKWLYKLLHLKQLNRIHKLHSNWIKTEDKLCIEYLLQSLLSSSKTDAIFKGMNQKLLHVIEQRLMCTR